MLPIIFGAFSALDDAVALNIAVVLVAGTASAIDLDVTGRGRGGPQIYA